MINITDEYLAIEGLSPTFLKRFWSKVLKTDGCWYWTKALSNKGYGRIGTGKRGKYIKAHRASWLIHFGPIPNGTHVLHHCDNPKCVRPDHLWLGTNKDNVLDAMNKGRNHIPKGELNGNSILTVRDVVKIRTLHRSGVRFRDIAKYFPQIKPGSLNSVLYGQHWKHVTVLEP